MRWAFCVNIVQNKLLVTNSETEQYRTTIKLMNRHIRHGWVNVTIYGWVKTAFFSFLQGNFRQ